MEMIIFSPLDQDNYLVEECKFNTATGKKTPTGRKFRKRGEALPASGEMLKVVQQEMKLGKVMIIYSPVDFKPYPYDLVSEE